jgi:hypothetical protein
MKMMNMWTYACAGLLATGALTTISAETSVQPANECSKELLIAYFPESFVTEALKKFNVPQDKWAAISSALTSKEGTVIKTVEEKAEKLPTNPLKDPKQRQEAVKIFRETLLQIFTEVLNQNGITDAQQIQAMLDDIQQQKAKRFAQCMEHYRSQVPAAGSQTGAAPQSKALADASADLSTSKDASTPSTDNGDDYDDDSDEDGDDEDFADSDEDFSGSDENDQSDDHLADSDEDDDSDR